MDQNRINEPVTLIKKNYVFVYNNKDIILTYSN